MLLMFLLVIDLASTFFIVKLYCFSFFSVPVFMTFRFHHPLFVVFGKFVLAFPVNTWIVRLILTIKVLKFSASRSRWAQSNVLATLFNPFIITGLLMKSLEYTKMSKFIVYVFSLFARVKKPPRLPSTFPIRPMSGKKLIKLGP